MLYHVFDARVFNSYGTSLQFLPETYTRQRGDLDELRKEWVAEMDRCTTIEVNQKFEIGHLFSEIVFLVSHFNF